MKQVLVKNKELCPKIQTANLERLANLVIIREIMIYQMEEGQRL